MTLDREFLYRLAADTVLVIHALFVLFVIVGLLLILVGKLRGWRWVTNPWFRLCHLLCIGFVVVQTWLGAHCPLTVWEQALRAKAGQAAYEGAFLAYWVQELLFYRAPAWVFMAVYSLFGGLIVASWFWVKPRPFRGS